MTMEEAASALGLAPRTAERTWAYARVWLHREIRRGGKSRTNLQRLAKRDESRTYSRHT